MQTAVVPQWEQTPPAGRSVAVNHLTRSDDELSFPLSIVIPLTGRLADLRRCLRSLSGGSECAHVEIVVVDRTGQATERRLCCDIISNEKIALRIVDVPTHTGIPTMRMKGIKASAGNAVAILEDHVICSPGWLSRALHFAEFGTGVCGGIVMNECTQTLADRCAFLVEYGSFSDAVDDAVTGNNVVYTRAALDAIELSDPVWDCVLHLQLKEARIPLQTDRRLSVSHAQSRSAWGWLTQRYHFGRNFAATRLTGASLPFRLAYALATAALPVLLFLRWWYSVRRHEAYRRDWPWNLPFIWTLFTAGAFGETLGALCGEGDSGRKVGAP